MLFAKIPSILDKSVGLYLPLIFEASKQTTTGSRRRERLALPLVPSRQTWERERALGLLMFDTRPNGRGREDSAEEMSQRNWTTEQSLSAPSLSWRFQFCATRQPIQFPSWFSTPSRRIRKENIGPWETRHTSNLEVPGDPGPGLPPAPHPAARSGSRVVRLGVGLRHRPSLGFAKSQASAACLRGHLRPRTRPFCAGSPQRPSAERQFLARSAAKLLKAFQSLPTFEIRPVRVVPCSRSPLGKGDEKTRRPGTPKLPAGFLEQNPILSPPLPSTSTAALRHAPILQPGSPEARRALPFWWDVSCNHLTRDPERKHRGKEKIKKVLP